MNPNKIEETMGTDKLSFKKYDFGRVILNIFIAFTVSIYLSFFIPADNWLIIIPLIFLIIAFLLTLFPFKKKNLSYFGLILLLFPILLLLLSPLALPPQPTPFPPVQSPPAPSPYAHSNIILFIIIILFILVPILLTLKKTKRPEKEIITPLKPDLLRSIFFLIYTSIGWTLFSYLLEMDKEFAGIAAIIAGLIVAGFDPNEIIAITRRNIA